MERCEEDGWTIGGWVVDVRDVAAEKIRQGEKGEAAAAGDLLRRSAKNTVGHQTILTAFLPKVSVGLLKGP